MSAKLGGEAARRGRSGAHPGQRESDAGYWALLGLHYAGRRGYQVKHSDSMASEVAAF
jgi:hypothetical protein